MEKEQSIFNFRDKNYTCIGWSRIYLDRDYRDYKEITTEILENSKFFTSEYGIYNEDWYREITPILRRWASIYNSNNHPELLFVFSSFFQGTYIFKLCNG